MAFIFKRTGTKDFSKFDVAATMSFGLDFNAAEGALFQLHVHGLWILLIPTPIKGDFGNARGYNFLAGIRLAAFFYTDK